MSTASNKKRPTNKGSALLTAQENEALFRMLGNENYTLATGVVQLLAAEPPRVREWQKKLMGVVCFVKDYSEKGYFLRLYDITKGFLIWEQAFYEDFMVNQKTSDNAPELITFEGDNFVYGLNFSSKDEATNFAQQVNKRYEQEQNKRYEASQRERSRAPISSQQNISPPNQCQNIAVPSSLNFGGGNNAIPNSGSVSNVSKSGGKKKKSRLTKNDIGLPTNFEHRVHVGWDPSVGFQTEAHADDIDPNIKTLLDKIGMPTNLGKKDRKIVYDIIEKFGGIDAVKNELNQQQQQVQQIQQPPPPMRTPPQVPNVSPSSAGRPNSVTTKTRELPPPPPPISARATPNRPGPPPPPPMNRCGGGGPPPPPPPPLPASLSMMSSAAAAPPPPPPMLNTGNSSLSSSAGGNDFLSQISKGVTLKPVSPGTEAAANVPKSTDSRDAMLKDIKEGVTLRPVDKQEKQRVTPPEEMGGIAGALARALQERRFQMTDDTDSGEDNDEEEDEEWDD